MGWDGCWQAWGRMQADLSGPGGFEQNLRLAGQYYDRESGLHYNLFRYYDPDVPGRFLSSDPIGLAGGINLYRYAPNALGWIDPWGLKADAWVPHGAGENDVISKGVHFNAGDKFGTELKLGLDSNGNIQFERVFNKDSQTVVDNAIKMANDKFAKDIAWRQRLFESAVKVKESLFENFNRLDRAREVKNIQKALGQSLKGGC